MEKHVFDNTLSTYVLLLKQSVYVAANPQLNNTASRFMLKTWSHFQSSAFNDILLRSI